MVIVRGYLLPTSVQDKATLMNRGAAWISYKLASSLYKESHSTGRRASNIALHQSDYQNHVGGGGRSGTFVTLLSTNLSKTR
ncbi:hypothetical protein FRX31_003885 [Thalictrum thalictroides]|uniref:Uncharacterized protein n=1 Tax=Thalictrum thalictroides TaxID=46969 RepID=A0A7J6XAN9_THATH|nr:hypothetical protein FRX31_003885 [Thalictrum thalictroides]